jgi:hypothetical protein
LVNQIIKEHLHWHANAPKAGFIAVRRCLIMDLLNYLSEQEIISVAEHVSKTTTKDSILFIEKEYTMKAALEFLENWIKMAVIIGFSVIPALTTSSSKGQYNNISDLKRALCTSKVLELAQKGAIRDAAGYYGGLSECMAMKSTGSIYGEAGAAT